MRHEIQKTNVKTYKLNQVENPVESQYTVYVRNSVFLRNGLRKSSKLLLKTKNHTPLKYHSEHSVSFFIIFISSLPFLTCILILSLGYSAS